MSKALNLEGKRFGKLTVLQRVDNYVSPNGKKKAKWKCLCECGNIVYSTTANLRSGKNQCWDCAHKMTGFYKRKNIVGKTFGYLTVNEIKREIDKNGKQRTICACTCRCGKEVVTKMDTLTRPGLHSCGCARSEIQSYRIEDYTGRRFGRLVVLEELADTKPKRVRCRCDCGNELIVIKTQLTRGDTQSCGCYKRDMSSQKNQKDWTGRKSEYGIEFLKQEIKSRRGPWLWRCRCTCGNEFVALPADIMSGKIKSCGCLSISHGELTVKLLLEKYDFNFIQEYTFKDCKDKYPLPFDFALIDGKNVYCLIEYDGRQHFEPTELFGGQEAFVTRVEHDNIKNNYCRSHNIPLIRIRYDSTNEEIEKIIANINKP